MIMDYSWILSAGHGKGLNHLDPMPSGTRPHALTCQTPSSQGTDPMLTGNRPHAHMEQTSCSQGTDLMLSGNIIASVDYYTYY